ncbi:MAG: CvpA family protein [Saprospiraceae bacterium]|nr:CvpA family protein [Saprospiraceae bacterium]
MILDLVCGIILAASFYLGYTKGILKTVFGVLSIIIGILAALKFSFLAINILEKTLTIDPRMNIIIGFVLTFVLVLIGIRMIGRGLEKILETAHINFVNQIAGGILSALISLVIFSSLIWFFDQIKVIAPETQKSSLSYPIIKQVPEKSKAVLTKIKPFFSEFWDKTKQAMDKVEPGLQPSNPPTEEELK